MEKINKIDNIILILLVIIIMTDKYFSENEKNI